MNTVREIKGVLVLDENGLPRISFGLYRLIDDRWDRDDDVTL